MMPRLDFNVLVKCPYCGHEYLVFGLELWITGYKHITWLPKIRCPVDRHFLLRKSDEELSKFFSPVEDDK